MASADDDDLAHIDPAYRARVRTTTSVRATDALAKVDDAGSVRSVDGRDVQVMHNGVVVERDCYGGPFMTEIIARLRGHHEPQEEVAFATLVETIRRDTPEPVMVELGSFWAYYSLWFKHELPAATVVLVEPDAANLEVGVRNFALNDLEPSSVVQAAVGAAHDVTIEIVYESDGAAHPVRAVTLEGLVAEAGLPRIDLLLCDVQGAEVEMLAGAASLVAAGRVRFMVISTHWADTDPLVHQTVRERVLALGGHVVCEHSLPESCSGDGLVVVSFDARDRGLHVDVPIVRSRDSEVGELEWKIASRSGLRGILWGVVDLVPARTRARLGATGIGSALHRGLSRRAA